MEGTKMHAVAYCRVSTAIQADNDNIELQVESLTKYAKKNNIEIVEWFKDEGVSGGLEHRPGLGRMMSYLELNNEVKVVLIFSLTRLARDLYIQEGLIREFTKLGKELLSLSEPDLGSNDATRKLFRQIIGAFSEFEKAMITLRMKNGRDSAVNKGRWHGGHIYGYDCKDGQLIVNEAEAEVVRKIFHLKRYKKMPTLKIAGYLNDNNLPTKKRTTKWWPSSVQKILRNKIYSKGLMQYKGQLIQGQFEKIL